MVLPHLVELQMDSPNHMRDLLESSAACIPFLNLLASSYRPLSTQLEPVVQSCFQKSMTHGPKTDQ
uniref:Putative ovule protein n=1 Tax=Solanum chacoense TaxID=4108 RepID=A0A0V0GPU8_SOLCH